MGYEMLMLVGFLQYDGDLSWFNKQAIIISN